jgi:hypothetical protein
VTADDLAWGTVTPWKHGRHDWILLRPTDIGYRDGFDRRCIVCGKYRNESNARRGRNNRSRGGRHELDAARRYGGEKTGRGSRRWCGARASPAWTRSATAGCRGC